ncbi:ribbon-helix-helix protein, CopG family [Bradyrhizobium sp. 151]|nr:ribbon-helix-helix protein, CopG family [Bradyrhizobium sp. 151]
MQKMTLLTVLPRSRTDNLKGRGATLTADLDRARIDLRLSRSEFLRRAIAAQLQQLHAAPK